MGNKVVILTLSMVVLAGLLSAGATLWLARNQSNSYDAALRDALREKALAYGITATSFVDVLGDDAITVLQSVAEAENPVSPGNSTVGGPEPTFVNDLLSFSVWLPEASTAGGYRSVVNEEYGPAGGAVVSEEVVLELVRQTDLSQSPAAAIDEEGQALLTSVVIPAGEGDLAVVVGVISAKEEFAFFAAQRWQARRNAIITSAAIVAFVSLIGGGLGYYLSRDLTSRRKSEQALREGENRFRSLLESAPDAMVIVDDGSLIETINEQTEALFGYDRDELIGMPVEMLIPERVRQSHRQHRKQYAAQPHVRPMGPDMDLTGVRKDASEFPVDVSLSMLETDQGPRAIAAVRDITDRKLVEDALRDSEEAMRDIIDTAYDPFVSTDADGRILAWNDRAEEVFGWSREEALGHGLVEMIIAPHERAEYEADIRRIERAKDSKASIAHRNIVAMHRSGRQFSAEVAVWATRTAKTLRLNIFIRDITERELFEKKLAHAANHDPLTNLFNRRRFEEELDRELASAQRFDRSVAVLFMDLDQFKDVNDSLGHRAGDELLVGIANVLSKALRQTDMVARIGGDEFAALLPGTNSGQAWIIAEKLLEALRDNTFAVADQSVRMTCSIGIASFPENGGTGAELLSHADVAMFEAKAEGRNRIISATSGENWQAEIAGRLNWRHRIQEALEKNLFILHAQPILDLERRHVSQYELLLRMTAESGEIVEPSAFLSIAERSGSIQEIERWVITRAIAIAAEQRRQGSEPCLEVNLSAKALADPDLLPLIKSELSSSGVNPASLIVEITETAAVANIIQAQDFVQELKTLGCRFALDDFGIGASSFYLLKHLPVDFLKIDGSFIRDLPNSTVDQHMVRAMVEIARGLGLKTIAEYVGDEETVTLLRELGVDYAQGYHVGWPGPVDQVLKASEIERAA